VSTELDLFGESPVILGASVADRNYRIRLFREIFTQPPRRD
jgi:hypothetical protein